MPGMWNILGQANEILNGLTWIGGNVPEPTEIERQEQMRRYLEQLSERMINPPMVIDESGPSTHISQRMGIDVSDWRSVVRQAPEPMLTWHNANPDPNIGYVSQQYDIQGIYPKGKYKIRFLLPKGIQRDTTCNHHPEYMFAERGALIPSDVWDAAGILKKRVLKFEFKEILDGVYIYGLTKI